jgi:hypothetical protein
MIRPVLTVIFTTIAFYGYYSNQINLVGGFSFLAGVFMMFTWCDAEHGGLKP